MPKTPTGIEGMVITRLPELRKQHGLTQDQLALKMRGLDETFKWTQTTVWAVEMGARPLRFSETYALAAVFGMEPSELWDEGHEQQLRRDAHGALRRAHEAVADAETSLGQLHDAAEGLDPHDPENVLLWQQWEHLGARLCDLARACVQEYATGQNHAAGGAGK